MSAILMLIVEPGNLYQTLQRTTCVYRLQDYGSSRYRDLMIKIYWQILSSNNVMFVALVRGITIKTLSLLPYSKS
jgi:hypothetical protein